LQALAVAEPLGRATAQGKHSPALVVFHQPVDEDGHITTLTVDPGWHHRGIGTVLLADLARAAPALGVRHLTLEVRVGNAPAQALYRRFGFAPVGVRKNYYAETGEDAIIMWARDVDTPAYGERLAAIEAHLGATS